MKIGTTFSGIGAPEEALKKLGIAFYAEWACDINTQVQKTYLANHACKKWYKDITQINITELSPVDLYCFGFPCQDISIVGNQDLTKGRSVLVNYSLDIIDFLLPKYILFENVFNLLSNRFKPFFSVIVERISKNYNFDYAILNSLDFGVPQNRRRVFGLGVRKDLHQLPNLKFDKINAPPLESILEDIEEFLPEDRQERLKKIAFELIKGFVIKDQYGVVNGVNKFNKTSIFAKTKIQYKPYCSCLNLVDFHGIITPKGQIRPLTVRECARLQGFSDSFVFPVKNSTAIKQLGNSITVNVLEEIFKQNL